MFRRGRSENDFHAEIEAHLEIETERLREQGLTYEQARSAAYRAFGNVVRTQERFYESRHPIWWEDLLQDIGYALRMLHKSPAFTAIATLTIALGIGATTAIFSVVDATLLHPLPYAQPEQLVSIEDNLAGVGAHDVGLSQPEWQDLQHSGIFQNVSPAWFDENNLTGSTEPARVRLLLVAPNYFSLLGVKPQLGRTFNPEDHSPGLIPECVLSDGLWKRNFGGDPHVLGKGLRLDTDLYRIVGVMPRGFDSPGRTRDERNIEVWVATSFYGPPMVDHPPRSRRNLPTAIARLKSGLKLAAAQSQVDGLVAAIQKEYPGDYPQQSRWSIRLIPLKETVVGDVRQPLVLLLGAVGLVLLIGCVNVSNLLLARASARGREMAIRQAIGAARSRLTRQLLTESLVLSALGGVAGITLLFCMRGFLLRLVPESLPRVNAITINWSVLLFALFTSLASGIVFGMAPSFHLGRLNVIHSLKVEGRGSTGSGEQSRTRSALVVTEFALSLVLMIAASLLLRSFWDLLKTPLGFNPENTMFVRTRLPYPNDTSIDKYKTASQQARFFHEVIRRGLTLPGVKEVAMGDTASVPLDASERALNMLAEGHFFFTMEGSRIEQPGMVARSNVTPEYFHLLRMPLLRGRLFNDGDTDQTPQVAVVNEAMVRTFWPREDPIGKRLKSTRAESPWVTVIGVIANSRTDSLAQGDVPKLYLSLYQNGAKHVAIYLRGHLDPAAIPCAVRDEVQSVDPTLPVFGAQTLNETVSASLATRRFSMEMVALFALTALLLAALGIYGVISYIVSERAHEFGIRRALGAQGRSIMGMVLRQGLALAITGTGIGLIGALIVSNLMAGLLYGVKPTDPATFVGVTFLLVGVALLACIVPAQRALRVDPMVALRCE